MPVVTCSSSKTRANRWEHVRREVPGDVWEFWLVQFLLFPPHHHGRRWNGRVSDQEDADLVRCLRAHGWTRELSNKDELHEQNAHIDSRFMFVNVGYNLRPWNLWGCREVPLLRLDSMNANRKENRERLLRALRRTTNGTINSASRSPRMRPPTRRGLASWPCFDAICKAPADVFGISHQTQDRKSSNHQR